MNTKSFDEFVSEQASSSGKRVIDWNRQLEEWHQQLAVFYERVEGLLEKYVTERKIGLRRQKKSIHEEFIGTYEVDTLVATLGSNTIRFDPVGTNLIGAKGRVDMVGPKGTVRFVLVDKESSAPHIAVRVSIQADKPKPKQKAKQEIEWVWKISTPPPSVVYIELESEPFYDAMMEVVNG